MVNVPQAIDINDLKCGVIYWNDVASYKVICASCQENISFEDFRYHFETQHLPQPVSESFPINFDDEDESSLCSSFMNTDEEDLYNEIGESKADTIEADDEVVDPLCVVNNDSDSFLTPQLNEETKYKIDVENESKFFVEVSYLQDDEKTEPDFKTDDEESWKDDFEIEQNQNSPKENTEVVCDICDLKCINKRSLKNHKRNAHNFSGFECTECDAIFYTERKLEFHMYTHRGLTCDVCEKAFARAHDLWRHKQQHIGNKPFKCHECDYATYTKARLKGHMVKHSNIRSHICDICGKGFKSNLTLTQHMKRCHSRERPLKCDVCSKRFFSTSELKSHLITHSDDRPFHCNYCGKDFRRKDILALHIKLHTGDAKYECKFCGKKYVDLYRLKKHKRCLGTSNQVVRGRKSKKVSIDSDDCHDIDLELLDEDSSMTKD